MKILIGIFITLLLTTTVHAISIQLTPSFGVWTVPVTINKTTTFSFIVDSGAGEVQISGDVFNTLKLHNMISPLDYLRDGNYVQADGSAIIGKRFVVKQLQVGNVIVSDVVVSVTPTPNGMLLLGQSFLQRFSSWGMNNVKHTLTLGKRLPVKTSPVVWAKELNNNIRMFVTNSPCPLLSLRKKGYAYLSFQDVALTYIQQQSEEHHRPLTDYTFATANGRATTISGCWDPDNHKAVWVQKIDDKTWEDKNFYINEDWTRLEQ